MKTCFVNGRSWAWLGVVVAILIVYSSAVHPFGSVKQPHGPGVSINALLMSPGVKALLQRSCQNCHSNQTVWPWYSYVAPVSWLIERDVRGGRDHMNLSRWPEYSLKKQEDSLADIASVLKNREMPLPQYTLMHRDAKLSDQEIDILYQWARVERRKIRAALASHSGRAATLNGISHSTPE